MAKTLREQKQEARKEWEACFKTNMEGEFTTEGMDHFYDEETSLDEAIDMLTACAIHMTFGDMLDDILDKVDKADGIVIIAKGNDKPKYKEGGVVKNQEYKYAVLNEKTNHLYSERFDTERGAREYLEDIAMNSEFKVNDLRVIKEAVFNG